MKPILRILRLLLPYRPFIAQSIVIGLIMTVLAIPPPLLTKTLIDRVLPTGDFNLLLVVIATVLMFSIGSAFLKTVSSVFSAILGTGMHLDLHLGFFDHVQRLSFGFHSENKVGEVLSRLGDMQRSTAGVLQLLHQFVTYVLMLIVFPAVLFWLSWRLTLVALSFMPVAAAVFYYLNRIVRRLSDELAVVDADLNAREYEALSGIKTVQSNILEDTMQSRVEGRLQESRRLSVSRSRYQAWGTFISAGVTSLGTFAYSFMGWRSILNGDLTLGSFLAFSAMLGYLRSPISGLISMSQDLQTTMVHANRFLRVHETVSEIQDTGQLTSIAHLRGEISFDAVTFGYRGTPVLRDVTLSVSPGETVAVVGHSGCGKTTILDLIMRFFEPQSGRILLDDHDIRDLSVKYLRSCIGYMRQEPFLFHGTILDNLCAGVESYDKTDLERATQAAGVDTFLSQTGRTFATTIGEGGAMLSTGQKQKLCLARLLLRRTPILLLDEPTAAWDEADGNRILANLNREYPQRTLIIVSHRQSTLPGVDRVLLLGNDGSLSSIAAAVANSMPTSAPGN